MRGDFLGYTIYLVEDEKSLNDILKLYLEKEGYNVTTFFNGETALEHIKDEPDIWILDIMLPDIDGYYLIKKIKENNSKTPVIFMSARNRELDRVVGLELGSDDYLAKPFLPRELIIRVKNIVERNYNTEKNTHIKVASYIIDIENRVIKENDIELELSNNEFELVLLFVNNIEKAYSREQLIIKVWGDDYFGSDRVVDDTIRRVRKKLPNLNIKTIYGYGYRMSKYEN